MGRVIFLAVCLLITDVVNSAFAQPPVEIRNRAEELVVAGHLEEAYTLYHDLSFSNDMEAVDLMKTIQLLRWLKRVNEIDAFRETLVELHGENPDILRAIALSYAKDCNHGGCLNSGTFQRGILKGNEDDLKNGADRDRVEPHERVGRSFGG